MIDDNPDKPALPPMRRDASPNIVYFDIAPAFGIMGGAIQIELASRILHPDGAKVMIEFVTNGHLRCSPAAAVDLRNAIDKALAMLEGPPDPTATGTNTVQ